MSPQAVDMGVGAVNVDETVGSGVGIAKEAVKKKRQTMSERRTMA